MPLLYALTLFVSAWLLFLVQPMVGKMVLPLLGGTPAVWTTCMVVFQGLLLGGYLYAHGSIAKLGARRQSRWHLIVLLLPILVMGITVALTGHPISVNHSLVPNGSDYPFFGTVAVLLATIGIPFFVVSTSAPMLQRWYSETGHPSAADPYFLYGASNLGSLLALIAYPAAVEPQLRLADQGWLFAGVYVVLVALIVACAAALRNSGGTLTPLAPPAPLAPIAMGRKLRWLALALVPSSLMLGATTYLSTDVAPIPLLWVIPLGLYLLTFVMAFGEPPAWLKRVNGVIATVLIVVLLANSVMTDHPKNLVLALSGHLAAFFLISLQCHLELASLRPEARRLTEFYLWVSLGGVLGGLLNALAAPVLLNALHEYPLALIAAALVLPGDDERGGKLPYSLDLVCPLVIGMVVYTLVKGLHADTTVATLAGWLRGMKLGMFARLADWVKDYPSTAFKLIVYGPAILVSYIFVERPVRFGLSLLALWLVATLSADTKDIVHQERSFFGVLQVKREEYGDKDDADYAVYQHLVHGSTLHGEQRMIPPSGDPLTYYHRDGPVGELFKAVPACSRPDLAFIGLGTGSLSAYGQKNQHVTYYEIDSAIRRIATDPKLFRFYTDCPSDKRIVMGDARLKLEEAADASYDVILVDAFSSDAIPVHLLTKEAMELYFRKLKPGGIVGLHVSNRFLELERVAARIAQELKLVARDHSDSEDKVTHKYTSHWIALARSDTDFGPLLDLKTHKDDGTNPPVWDRLLPDPTKENPLWTDDFSNVLGVRNFSIDPREWWKEWRKKKSDE